jgi:tetratricopeptide (TPR) repeat protein
MSSPSPARPEAYVLSLLSEGKFDIALEVIAELGSPELYWPDFHNHAQRLAAAGQAQAARTLALAAMSLDPRRTRGSARRKVRRVRPEAPPTLSVCMIVRDEEDTLGRCLESVRGLADEMVVVDTGSQDATVGIAQHHGAQVHHFAWRDDFAAAKNEALRHATGDWILVLDADDELGDAAGLKEYLGTAQRVNLCTLRTRIPHRGQASETIVEHPRLFRNRIGLHYCGPVHEQLCDDAGDPAAADAALDLCVYHHGYLEGEPEQAQRHLRNLRILRAWVARSPDDPWAQFCLGQAHYTHRDPEQAIPPLTASLQHAAPDRAYRPKAYAYLASAHVACRRPQQAEELCRAALEKFPHQAELLFCLGHALECQGRAEQAMAAYEAATRGRFGPMLAYHDFTCRDLKPLARLANIYASRGRFDDADECVRRAQRIRGAVPALAAVKERIASARQLAQRAGIAPEAVAAARDALVQDGGSAAAHVRLAAALLGSGDRAEAEHHLRAALELDPACPEALNLHGVLLCARGDHAAAVESFQRAAALRPDYADALCNLGAARLRANDIERAERAFREALAADASCFTAHLALGEIAQARGDGDAAIASYEAALHADAGEPAAWLGLARSYLAGGAYDPAARCYAKAAQDAGHAPEVMAEIERVRRRLAGLSAAVA